MSSLTNRFLLGVLAFFSAALCLRAADVVDANEVQTTWRLLDYIAVDYAGAVRDGRVINQAEYAEQLEFAGTVAEKIAALPARAERQPLQDETTRLQAAITARDDPARVAELAHGLATDLIAAWPVAMAPGRTPNLARGAALYQQQCASCHGVRGGADGPAAAALEPPPIDFTDIGRARQRSVLALYQAISQGIEGTSMTSYAALPSADRWALAFYVGKLAFSDAQAKQGERLWQADAALRAAIPDLAALAGFSPAALARELGPERADATLAWLRAHPEALATPAAGDTLALARAQLAQSLAAYRRGAVAEARQLALSAYLDGFEPVEPALGARSGTLLREVEEDMAGYRSALQRGEDVDSLQRRVEALDELLIRAATALAAGPGSSTASFLAAGTILLREGLEALLIIVAMIAFLRKAERSEVVRYVHAGWIGALVAGGLTWAAATWLIQISGASRELTEGFGSVFAAVVLVTVGIWMHGKSHADHWQRYIHDKLGKALSGRTAWLLLGLAFLVVYREVFETILFFAALWSQGNGSAMLAGAAAASLLLALLAWVLLRFSRRLPIGQFFSYSAWLMAVLAVVLAGKGISALQEAGWIDITPLSGAPRATWLGFFPTMQTILAQAATIVALLAGFAWNRRSVT